MSLMAGVPYSAIHLFASNEHGVLNTLVLCTDCQRLLCLYPFSRRLSWKDAVGKHYGEAHWFSKVSKTFLQALYAAYNTGVLQ